MSILKEVLARRAEGVEEVNELSREHLTRYIDKVRRGDTNGKNRDAGKHLAQKKKWGDAKHGLPEPRVKATEEVEVTGEELTEEQLEEIVNTMTVLEYEQLDELSKNTLKSYVKKATKSGESHYAKADKAEDKAMSTDGEKHPERQAKHQATANHHISQWRKRDSGVKTATKKLSK